MRKREAVGRTIVDVGQTRRWDETVGHTVVSCEWIRLDNGRLIFFMANDDGIENYVTAFTALRR